MLRGKRNSGGMSKKRGISAAATMSRRVIAI
jgi:hypothetical protein